MSALTRDSSRALDQQRIKERILVVGGFDGQVELAESELLEVQAGSWSRSSFVEGPLAPSRRWGSVIANFDMHELVIIFGGFEGNGYTSATEILYLGDRTFEAGPPMLSARAGAAAAVLDDDRVFILGGYKDSSCEVYDVAHGQTSPAVSLNEPLACAAAVCLGEAWQNKILVAGGYTGMASSPTRATLLLQTLDENDEFLEPHCMRFTQGPDMLQARGGCAAALLDAERVIIVGGFDGTNRLASTEILNLETMTFAPGPSLSTARSGHVCLSVGEEGYERPIVFGGFDGRSYLSTGEILVGMGSLEGQRGSWQPGPSMAKSRAQCAIALVNC
mmetsp:Transcript_43639/g.79571  ORF Transcript_43639/g.79571 Transcript_43639/m.79571 type:complete len:333 (+) Transcript_43639:14-1012(+)